MLWTPPASITSASPRRISSAASPIAWALAEQAVRHERFGPLRPEGGREVPGRRPRLLLGLEERVEESDAPGP